MRLVAWFLSLSKRIGDRVTVALQCRQMMAERRAGDATVMPPVEHRRQTNMRRSGFLPESDFLLPIGFVSGAARSPDLDADILWIAAFGLGQAAQLRKYIDRRLIRRIGVRHPAVAPFGDARQGFFMMAA